MKRSNAPSQKSLLPKKAKTLHPSLPSNVGNLNHARELGSENLDFEENKKSITKVEKENISLPLEKKEFGSTEISTIPATTIPLKKKPIFKSPTSTKLASDSILPLPNNDTEKVETVLIPLISFRKSNSLSLSKLCGARFQAKNIKPMMKDAGEKPNENLEERNQGEEDEGIYL